MDHSLQRHYFVKIKSLDVANLDRRRFAWWNGFVMGDDEFYWCGRLKGQGGGLFIYRITLPIFLALAVRAEDSPWTRARDAAKAKSTVKPSRREQFKAVQKRMIDLDLSTGQIADELGTSTTMISQLIHGHNYYPRYAEEMYRRYKILIPDTRDLRRAAA